MRCIKREINRAGHIILTCEKEKRTQRFLRSPKIEKITVKFIATEKYVSDYWKWRLLPDKILVPDGLSFQLDAWNRDLTSNE